MLTMLMKELPMKMVRLEDLLMNMLMVKDLLMKMLMAKELLVLTLNIKIKRMKVKPTLCWIYFTISSSGNFSLK